MESQTLATIRKYVTGAIVVALGGAVGAASTMLEAGPITNYKALGAAMFVGAVLALRLWLVKETSGIFSIFGLEKSFGDKLAESPKDYFDDGGILYNEILPNLEKQAQGLTGLAPTLSSIVEVRKFSDPRLQEALETVFANSGGKNGMFFNVNLNGEVRAGVAVKAGGHLSVGGFLEKKPGLKLEGLVQFTYAF